MRWHVDRKKEIVGPVDHDQVAAWLRKGMTEGSVRREDEDRWVSVDASPFAATAAPKKRTASNLRAGLHGRCGAIRVASWRTDIVCRTPPLSFTAQT